MSQKLFLTRMLGFLNKHNQHSEDQYGFKTVKEEIDVGCSESCRKIVEGVECQNTNLSAFIDYFGVPQDSILSPIIFWSMWMRSVHYYCLGKLCNKLMTQLPVLAENQRKLFKNDFLSEELFTTPSYMLWNNKFWFAICNQWIDLHFKTPFWKKSNLWNPLYTP